MPWQPVAKMLIHLVLILYFSTFSCLADYYYRWIDGSGTLHFSDKPPSKAFETHKHPLPLANSVKSAITIETEAKPTAKKQQIAHVASKIKILSPVNQETIRNNAGSILIRVQLDNPLADQQYVQISLNGKKQKRQKELVFKLQNIARGEHRIKAMLLKKNKVLSSSKDVRVFVHRSRKTM